MTADTDDETHIDVQNVISNFYQTYSSTDIDSDFSESSEDEPQKLPFSVSEILNSIQIGTIVSNLCIPNVILQNIAEY